MQSGRGSDGGRTSATQPDAGRARQAVRLERNSQLHPHRRLLGTVLVNMLRMTIVSLVAVDFGFWPARLVHDYGGTLIIVAWLFAFWAFAHTWILGNQMAGTAEAALA
jgi:hypothetical protein